MLVRGWGCLLEPKRGLMLVDWHSSHDTASLSTCPLALLRWHRGTCMSTLVLPGAGQVASVLQTSGALPTP